MSIVTPPVKGEPGIASRLVNDSHEFPGILGTIPTFTAGRMPLLVAGWNSSTRSMDSVQDNAGGGGNTWVQVDQFNSGTARIAWFRMSNLVGQPTTIYLNFSGALTSDCVVQIVEYEGADPTTLRFEHIAYGNGDGTQSIGATLVPVAGSMSLEGISHANNRVILRDSRYNYESINRRLHMQDRIVVIPDTTTELITIDVAGSGAMVRSMIMFDPAGTPTPQPPVQISDIPDITGVNQGENGSTNVASRFTLGANGVGPLEFYKDETNGPAWPADLDIVPNGTISWTGAVAPGVDDLRVSAVDIGVAPPGSLATTSNPFNYEVTGPNPPNPTGTYPDINISTGASYSDPTVRFEIANPGGTGPLTYSQSPAGTAWPADITINATTGEITVASGVTGATTGLRVRCTDSGNGLFTDGNAFQYNVTSQDGTITTTPAKNTKKELVTGLTNAVCIIIDAATGAQLHYSTGNDQNPDGTFSKTTSDITPGGQYMGGFWVFNADGSLRWHGSFDLTAT